MAFPTTQMSGYADLKGRITLALSRCQEQLWLDFKESQPWPMLRWRLLKTIMGMANLRDGGLILVGVAEKGTSWELTGIDPGHLLTFDYDDIIDQLSKYASPQVNLDIVVHDHEDGKRYLAFHIHQFNDTPVICRNTTPDSVRPKDRLAAGEVYVRPATGKPQTTKVTDAARLHDLLELAAEFRARRMLEVGKRVGLVPSESATSLFDAEFATISQMPVPVKDYPHWIVVYRPETYNTELIPSLTDCMKLVEKARVRLRGWDFPHLSNRESDRSHGSNWIGSWASFMCEIQYWQLFQSGQFAHFAAATEAVVENWREKMQKETMSHLRYRKDINWSAVPGYLSLLNLVYTVTEYFEFAARICQAGVYRGRLHISLELTGVKGFVLSADWNRAWSQFRPATENRLLNTWSLSSEELIAGSINHSLRAIVWLCECFGWMSPNEEAIKKDQEKLLSRNL